jgi:hypothetical protein
MGIAAFLRGRNKKTLHSQFLNIVIVAANEAQPIVDEERKDKQNKYEYKVNINQAVVAFKDIFKVALLIDDPVKRAEQVGSIIIKLSKNVIPIRPDRSIPRNPHPRKANFHHNQKSNY